MATVKENLIEAKALIDTPEKYDAEGIITPLLANGVSIARFNQMRNALLKAGDAPTDRIAVWVRGRSHEELMELFDRAIASQP